jgi:N-acetylglucosamine-6-phosphate deacetylase
VLVDNGVVADVGVSPAGTGGLAVPGFVDLQVNGFAGVDFAATDLAGYATATAAMAATGVTSFQPTLISLPWDAYPDAIRENAEAMADPVGTAIIGLHLEGPFLSPVRNGAHSAANLLLPDVNLAAQLVARDGVSHVTIAPELPDALSVIDLLVDRGVTVAVGHSNADAAEAHAAFDRGASVVTHLFNAQRPWGPRGPGISGAAMARRDVTVTAIVDGVHLSNETVMMAFRACPDRFALITDAIAATGRPDGTYPLGDRSVVVADGEAHLADGTLAGSVLTMDAAVRNLVALGVDVPDAVGAATSVPARVAGRSDLGVVEPGSRADIAVWDDRLEVVRTIASGREIWAG